jgi:hypothetical protein
MRLIFTIVGMAAKANDPRPSFLGKKKKNTPGPGPFAIDYGIYTIGFDFY